MHELPIRCRSPRDRRSYWPGSFALVAGLLLFAAPGYSQYTGLAPTNPVPRIETNIPPTAFKVPDNNVLMELNETQVKRNQFEAVNAERKRQLDADSAMLLKLAAELKAEVDKTSQDVLSVTDLRKAEEIEQLAHIVQEKMKLTVGGN